MKKLIKDFKEDGNRYESSGVTRINGLKLVLWSSGTVGAYVVYNNCTRNLVVSAIEAVEAGEDFDYFSKEIASRLGYSY